MNKNNLKKEEFLFEEILLLLEVGLDRSDILGRFPKYQKQVQEIFQLIDAIGDFGSEMKPSKELAKKIVEDYAVTFSSDKRYKKRGGFIDSTLNWVTQLKNVIYEMKNKTKILTISGSLVTVAIFALFFSIAFLGGRKNEEKTVSLNQVEKNSNLAVEDFKSDSTKRVSEQQGNIVNYDPNIVAQTDEEEVDLAVDASLAELEEEIWFEEEENDLAVADLDFSELDKVFNEDVFTN